MNTLNDYISEYIEYCEYRKRLDSKTLKAYRIDLKQYSQRLFLFTPYRHSCLRSMPTRGRLNLNISIDAA